MSFDQLDLRDELLKAVVAKGYVAPTPVQARAIPVILEGRDILARAQTGTGKTDAFALPMVEILSRHIYGERHPRALVLAPTRELALQVGESIKAYARRVSLRCTVVYGGINIEPQIERLHRGVDILVATPGRLLDLAGQGHLDLSRIEFLVFDEADRMLDLGFSREISQILELLPTERRTMLFSATYTQEIRNLAAILLKDPECVEVTPTATAAESVVQKVHLVEQANKRALLIHLLASGKWSRVLVFCRTKHGANRITEKLVEQGLRAAALHGNKSQSLRTRTLEEFRRGDVRILVATDVAARGLDIVNLPYVVNYDMPTIAEDYVHRIGRTGRAGETGIAVSLVSHEENRHLQAIETLLGQKIPVEIVTGYSEGTDVPDYVLYRPNNAASEKKAGKAIKELVAGRAAAKAAKSAKSTSGAKPQGKTEEGRGAAKGSGRRASTGPKPSTGRRNDKSGRPPARSGASGSQSLKQGKRRGRG
ncbi:DEAD/DEAH box helicase [Desulfobulbus sp.]|uniref:DEAD/DEAH box helicase n=1 Tax=Desulfobulbus sp. TaxID=895 RepID=UPI0027BAA847|nr:DEAD/DEAH box helicase [Desulfobulbus sp.]